MVSIALTAMKRNRFNADFVVSFMLNLIPHDSPRCCYIVGGISGKFIATLYSCYPETIAGGTDNGRFSVIRNRPNDVSWTGGQALMESRRNSTKLCVVILTLSSLISSSILATIELITTTETIPDNSCEMITDEYLICFAYLPAAGDSRDIKILEFHDIIDNVLNIDEILTKFPNLQQLSVENGKISAVEKVQRADKIQTLRLKNLQIDGLPPKFLQNFNKLEILNLQGNHLKKLPTNLMETGRIKEIYLSDNHWNCSEDLSWILTINSHTIKDLDNVTCFNDPYNNKPVLPIAQIINNMNNECPKLCTCTLPKIVRNPESDNLEPIIYVNCSSRNLNEMPTQLPIDTKILHLENNNIHNIKPLKSNHIYGKIYDIYLDNNQIDRIDELEGSYWLRNFRVLSICGNRISELPTYVLDNALQQNPNMPDAIQMYFGNNPWRCDCVFTPVFQEMLQKFAPQIEDITDIRCSYVEGDKNSKQPIIELSRSSVCRLSTDYSIQALDLVNGILASLIVLILAKLGYDYYYFKRTGRLPWIVTKMP